MLENAVGIASRIQAPHLKECHSLLVQASDGLGQVSECGWRGQI